MHGESTTPWRMLAKLAITGERSPQDICKQIIEVATDGDDDTALLAVMRTLPDQP